MGHRQELWELAMDQQGYVATWQAREIGTPSVEVRKLAARGALRQVARGVYRFEDFPAGPHGDLWRCLLWAGRGAVLSHESALAGWQLCDVNPTRVEVTVPMDRRLRRAEVVCEVHREDVLTDDLSWWEGLPVVTPRKAIEQGISSGVAHHLLTQAISTARARGRVRPAEAADLERALHARVAAATAHR
ncbi:type IV toxin-antitoxin system AbiEi family antitoxin domain-containing protein [Streptomyces sp. NP160]|uniref:type IV toxin-antitoxin system AbiEi family antitoxin domain-containing protein n=1 Tax=Streptomyces sp. NP160 TaxID=2586637 RepID=UPI001C56460F|nr:type IV toxin-antitoxin system AbiEi family antitoxin domain-containing protein [Streptomyces sp. NP160]